MSDSVVQAVSGSIAQEQARNNARAAFARLPSGHALFQQCINNQETIHEVLDSLQRQCGSHKRKKFTKILNSLHRYTSWIDNISGSIDVAVQASSGIACPLWAPIKFVLKVSQDHLEAAEQTLAVIQTISDNLSRLDLYEQLYGDPRFQTALVNVFTEVLEFAVRAYQSFSHGAPRRLARLIRSSLNDEFGPIISRIEKRTKVVDDLASALSQVRAAEFFQESQERIEIERRIRCMQWLRPSNVRENHQGNIASRVNTTCEWIVAQPKFKDWLNLDTSESFGRFMVIQGPAGCGKSILGSFIFDMLERKQLQQPTSRELTVLFSFSISDANRRTYDSLARSLLSQLLEQDTDGILLPLLENLMAKAPPSTSEISEALEGAVERLPFPIRSVIDGVDECSDSGHDVCKRLVKTSRKRPNFHVVVLGRPQAFAQDLGSHTALPTICITPNVNRDDIKTFVNFEIARCTTLSTSTIRDAVLRSLLVKADGMFLWVRLMLDGLKRAATDDEITKRLDDLPRGLEEAYRQILNRLVASIDKHQQMLVRTLFILVTVCGRPLETEELRYIYAMIVKPKSTSSSIDSFLLRLQPEQIIDLCGGMLIFRDGAFSVVHGSVTDFLNRPVECWSDVENSKIQMFQSTFSQSHSILGDACVRYLAEVDCSKMQLEQAPSLKDLDSPPPLLQYACSYIAYHLNRSNLSTDQLMDTFRVLMHSDQCLLVAEYLSIIVITDSSLQPQEELLELIKELGFEDNDTMGLGNLLLFRWEQEFAARVSKFGEADPRTKRWVNCRDSVLSLLSFNDGLDHCPSHAPLKNIDCQCLDIADATDSTPQIKTFTPILPRVEREQTRTMPQAVLRTDLESSSCGAFKLPLESAGDDLEFLVESFQASHNFSLGHQFEILIRLIRPISIIREILDPLKALWQLIKSKASSMPVPLLVAAAIYYFRFRKNEEALELCKICLGRLSHRDAKLKLVLDHIAGLALCRMREYDKAIPHLVLSSSSEVLLLGLEELIQSVSLQLLTRCYYQTDHLEKALETSNTLLQGDFESAEREIQAYYQHGGVLTQLGQTEDAIRSFQTCVDLFDFIPENLRNRAVNIKVKQAHRRIAMFYFCQMRYQEAGEAIQQYQSIQAELPTMATSQRGARFMASWARVLAQNVGQYGVSEESAKNALRASIPTYCQTLGPEECATELDYWYRLASEELPGDGSTSEQAIANRKRYLDIYLHLHETEPLKSLHRIDDVTALIACQ